MNSVSGSLRRRFTARRARDKSATAGFEIPSLNGIRALAVTVVFMTHAGINPAPGKLGVTVFFFLSGYLITTLLRMEFDRTSTIDFKAFYLRRAFRILPPLYLVLILADVLTLGGSFSYSHMRLGACLSQVFFLSNYQMAGAGWFGAGTGRAPGTEQLWSLAVEEHFYLIYPMVYLFLRRYLPSAKRQAAVLLGICAAVLAWRFVMVLGLHASVSRVYIGTDTRIDGILFGCVLGVVGNPVLDLKKPGEESRLSRLWAPILAPVGILAIILFYVGTDSPAPSFLQPVAISQTVQYTVEGLALIPLFVVAIRHYNWGIFKLLNTRTAKLVGAMSYSIYIVHELVIVWVHRHLGGGRILHGPIYLIITVIIGFVMLRFVERPCARLRKRLSRALGKDGTYAPAPAPDRAAPAPARALRHPEISPVPAEAMVGALGPSIQLE
jgi:peptidoglycan/LPS O-acetylase OafA/YrhL